MLEQVFNNENVICVTLHREAYHYMIDEFILKIWNKKFQKFKTTQQIMFSLHVQLDLPKPKTQKSSQCSMFILVFDTS
jgi:hypothetical protein